MAIRALTEQRRQKKYAAITQHADWQQRTAEGDDEADEQKMADTLLSPAARFNTVPRPDSPPSDLAQSRTVVELQPAPPAHSSSAPLAGSSAPPPPDEVDDSLQVASTVGLKYSLRRELLYYTLTLCTGGLSSLLAFWFPVYSYLRRYSRCPVDVADFILVTTKNGQSELCSVEPISASPASQLPRLLGRYQRPHQPPLSADNRMIVFRHSRYILQPASRSFVRLSCSSALPCSHIITAMSDGLSSAAASSALSLHGGNELLITVPSVPSLLIHEVLHPFFVFQLFSLVLWCFEQYFYFAACIFIIAAVSIATTVIETRRRLFALAELARFSSSVTVLRDGSWSSLPSSSLVPGDVLQVGTGVLPCDVALLSGSCVVNESMLTGESLPILKSPVDLANKPSTAIISLTSASHTLFSATSVLQLKPAHPHSHPLGLVTRTGWSTTKGSLILSILYPTPSSFRFVQQSFKFVGCLFLLSLVGFFISVYQLERLGASAGLIVVRALDLITIIVPPSLPLALSVGTNYALVALRRAQVCCISPNRINMAGKVRVMCFDKTGTLTGDGMDMKGVREVSCGQFRGELVETVVTEDGEAAAKEESASMEKRLAVLDSSSDTLDLDVDVEMDGDNHRPSISSPANSSSLSPSIHVSPMLLCGMSCCHSLAVLDGALIGDPLEVQIFRATRATLLDKPELSNMLAVSVPSLPSSSAVSASSSPPPLSRHVVRVLHQYEFQSSLQRMTVICRDEDGRTLLFTKGAPEVVARLCTAESLPHDYTDTFSQYARHGYRLIAIAYKQLPALPDDDKDAIRPQLECELSMLGLIVLENKVKAETKPTLAELQAAKVRCVMVTGDHVVTAVSVANECGLVEADTRIYQGRMNGEEIEWADTADESRQLDPLTLRPASVTGPHRYELAVTGDVFRHLSASPSLSTLFHRVLLSCVVFARMTPDQKALLLTSLQSLQLYAGMCGDGANDCLEENTPVMLADGRSTKLAREVLLGDQLLGTGGRTAVVMSEPFTRPEAVMYRISADSGASFTVTPGHLVTLAWRHRTSVSICSASDTSQYPSAVVELWRSDTVQPVFQRFRFRTPTMPDPALQPGFKQYVVYRSYEEALAAYKAWVAAINPHGGFVNTYKQVDKGRIFATIHLSNSPSPELSSSSFSWVIPGRAWTPEPILVNSAAEAEAYAWSWYHSLFHIDIIDTELTDGTTTATPIDSALHEQPHEAEDEDVLEMLTIPTTHPKTVYRTELPDTLPDLPKHWSLAPVESLGWRPLQHGDLIEVRADALANKHLFNQLAIRAALAHVGYVHSEPTDEEGTELERSVTTCMSGLKSVAVDPTATSSVGWQVDGDGRFVLGNGLLTHNCGALKAANVGVSLSSSEASIAAPFTYLQPNIRCVPLLLSEGRSALQTSFSLFRFIAMYSLIQFSAVILTYFVGSVLGNWQYLYQDMLVVFVLTLCIGATDASRQLSVKRPSADLLSFANLVCVAVHMLICVAFQVLVFSLVSKQAGYIDYTATNAVGDASTMETTSLYYFSNFQYLLMAVLFAMGNPWKRPLYTNLRFTGWCIVVLSLNLALLFSPGTAGFWRSDDVELPSEWRGRLFALVLFHLTVSCAWELAGLRYCTRCWKRWKRSRGEVGWVYGHLKRISGPGVKEYHRLRGEFEQGWGMLNQ